MELECVAFGTAACDIVRLFTVINILINIHFRNPLAGGSWLRRIVPGSRHLEHGVLSV